MNKADLIEALAPKVGGRAAATMAVESLVDAILREVAAGGSVVLTGFGTFERVERAARTGRNPRTGAAVPIEATSSPRFRPAAYFKDVVGDPSRLPKDGLAGVRVGSDGTAPAVGGVPSSVRRSAQPRTSREEAPGASSSSTAAGGDSTRRRATTGTPATVRAEAAPSPAPSDAPEDSSPGAGGGLVSGGEEITMGMINAKKAQLERVKSDERAGRARAEEAEGAGKGSTKGKRSAKDATSGKDTGSGKGRKSKPSKKAKKTKKAKKGKGQ